MSTDTKTVALLWEEARRLKLHGVRFCCVYSVEEMAAAFNGCGPEWMPPKARSLLDRIFADFAPCFLLHDVTWEHNDGTERMFAQSNEELLANCLTMADAKHPWWSPLRYVRRHQARLVYAVCRDFGRIAYNQAYYETFINTQRKEQTK